MDTFNLRTYLNENRLLQPINEYGFSLSPSLIAEAKESGIDAAQGIKDASKVLGIDAQELANAVNAISKAEKEGDEKEVKKIQKNLSETLNEAIGFTAGVAIASLIPRILNAVGRGSNWLKTKIPGAMKPEARKEAVEAIADIKGKKKEQDKLKDAIEFATGLTNDDETLSKAEYIKKLPAPTDPNYNMLKPKFEKYQQARKDFIALEKEIKTLEDNYDRDYGAFYAKDYKSWVKNPLTGKPVLTIKGNVFKKLGDKLHHLYLKPFKGILWALGKMGWEDMKDPMKREKAATIFYAITMIATAGYGVAHHLGAIHGIKGLTEMGTEIADGSLAGEEAAEALFALNDLATQT